LRRASASASRRPPRYARAKSASATPAAPIPTAYADNPRALIGANRGGALDAAIAATSCKRPRAFKSSYTTAMPYVVTSHALRPGTAAYSTAKWQRSANAAMSATYASRDIARTSVTFAPCDSAVRAADRNATAPHIAASTPNSGSCGRRTRAARKRTENAA